jgi:hypothetical protein
MAKMFKLLYLQVPAKASRQSVPAYTPNFKFILHEEILHNSCGVAVFGIPFY